MARTITLFTRFLKGWRVAGGAIPDDAQKVVTLTTESNRGWKASTVAGYPRPTLADLVAAPAVATVGTAYTGAVTGRTAGSTLTIAGAGAAGLSINSTTGVITGTPTAAGPVNVVETLAGAIGSPKTNAAVITVSA